MRLTHPNVLIGIGAILFAAVLVFVWTPLDTDTGVVERARGKYAIGDGLAPTLAGAFLFLSGVLLLFETRGDPVKPSAASWRYMGRMILLICAALAVMRYAGPALAALMDLDYRPLRDTAPWKYIGFALGGLMMTTGAIAIVEGRPSLRGLLIGLATVVAIILLYDLPFEDILLPPNGDV